MQPSSTPDPHYDPSSTPEQPRWDLVDIRFMYKFAAPLSLDLLRGQPGLKGMELLRKGSRLSVQPVRKAEWNQVVRLGRGRADLTNGLWRCMLKGRNGQARQRVPSCGLSCHPGSDVANPARHVLAHGQEMYLRRVTGSRLRI